MDFRQELKEIIANEFAVNPDNPRVLRTVDAILAHNWVKHLVIRSDEELRTLARGSVIMTARGQVVSIIPEVPFNPRAYDFPIVALVAL